MTGAAGADGTNGTNGLDGATGPPGADGATGPAGPTGVAGLPGEEGSDRIGLLFTGSGEADKTWIGYGFDDPFFSSVSVAIPSDAIVSSITCIAAEAPVAAATTAHCELYARALDDDPPADDPDDTTSDQFILGCIINADKTLDTDDDRSCMGMVSPLPELHKFDTVGVYIDGDGSWEDIPFKATVLIGTT